jgi:DNA-binding transcriptional LysR family regulator
LDLIVKFGSFKAAAEAMHKSQPSLSMAVKKLEEEFNIEIFNRDGYRPVLTEIGKAFHQKAIGALDQFQELEKLGLELGAGFESQISICTDAIFPIQNISNVLQKFFDPHITTTLDLSTDVLDGVIEKLNKHEVDFALGPDYQLNSNIEKIRIAEVEIIPVIGTQYKDKITLELLQSIPQIIVSSSVKEKRNIVSGAVSKQFWNTGDFSMKEQLIASGLGWGRLPIHLIDGKLEREELIEIEHVPNVKRMLVPMYLLRSKSKIMGPNTKNLWNYLSQLGEK